MESKKHAYEKIKRPTEAQITKIADKLGLHFSQEETKSYMKLIDKHLALYDILNGLPDNLPQVKYPRLPGYQPSESENKLNAWYVKTEVKGAPTGKLSGKKIVLKDNICLAGVPMMNGTSILEGYIPEIDATIVTRILDAGGTIVGKAHSENLCAEAGSITNNKGVIHNPHKYEHMTGGSSSGTCALVGSGEVDMGIGTDNGGSIRIPSSWCGCYGMKPTYGLVPFTGIMNCVVSTDHAGPITNNVYDNALLLEVIAGPDDLDPRQHIPEGKYGDYTSNIKAGVKDMKIGIIKEGFGFKQSEPIVDEFVKKAAYKFQELGAIVEEISIPEHSTADFLCDAICLEGAYMTMMQNGSLGTKGLHLPSLTKAQGRWKSYPDQLSIPVKLGQIVGDYVWNEYHGVFQAKAHNLIRNLRKVYNEKLKEYDILITPTVPLRAKTIPEGEYSLETVGKKCYGMGANCGPFNATGLPAMTIPVAIVEELPIGMQIISGFYKEAVIYQAAYAWEQAFDWKKIHE